MGRAIGIVLAGGIGHRFSGTARRLMILSSFSILMSLRMAGLLRNMVFVRSAAARRETGLSRMHSTISPGNGRIARR